MTMNKDGGGGEWENHNSVIIKKPKNNTTASFFLPQSGNLITVSLTKLAQIFSLRKILCLHPVDLRPQAQGPSSQSDSSTEAVPRVPSAQPRLYIRALDLAVQRRVLVRLDLVLDASYAGDLVLDRAHDSCCQRDHSGHQRRDRCPSPPR